MEHQLRQDLVFAFWRMKFLSSVSIKDYSIRVVQKMKSRENPRPSNIFGPQYTLNDQTLGQKFTVFISMFHNYNDLEDHYP